MYVQLGYIHYIVILPGQKGPAIVNLYMPIYLNVYMYMLITIFIVLSHNDL